VSNMHHTWLPYPPTKNIIQHSPWAGWTLPPTKLKSINSNSGVEWNSEPVPENGSGARSWTLSEQKREKQQELRAGVGDKTTSQKWGCGVSLS
jgi:hypothetical protein